MFHGFICHFIECNMVLVQWLFHSIRYNYSKLCSQFSTTSSGGSKVLAGVSDLGLLPCVIADVIPCKKWRCRNLVNLPLCSMFFLYDYSWQELVKLCTTIYDLWDYKVIKSGSWTDVGLSCIQTMRVKMEVSIL